MKIILTHPQDPSLSLTLGRPTKDAWGAAWDTVSSARSKEAGTVTAGYNLMLECATAPAPAGLPTLADDWPFAPMLAFINGAVLAGQLAFVESDAIAAAISVNAWRFDLAEVVKAARYALANAIDADSMSKDATLAPAAAPIEALAVAALTLDACEDILARFGRRGQLTSIRTTAHGVIIIRRPPFMAGVVGHANNVTAFGHYEAAVRLAALCTVFPQNIAMRFDDAPALATSIATLANSMVNEGAGAQVKKE